MLSRGLVILFAFAFEGCTGPSDPRNVETFLCAPLKMGGGIRWDPGSDPRVSIYPSAEDELDESKIEITVDFEGGTLSAGVPGESQRHRKNNYRLIVVSRAQVTGVRGKNSTAHIVSLYRGIDDQFLLVYSSHKNWDQSEFEFTVEGGEVVDYYATCTRNK